MLAPFRVLPSCCAAWPTAGGGCSGARRQPILMTEEVGVSCRAPGPPPPGYVARALSEPQHPHLQWAPQSHRGEGCEAPRTGTQCSESARTQSCRSQAPEGVGWLSALGSAEGGSRTRVQQGWWGAVRPYGQDPASLQLWPQPSSVLANSQATTEARWPLAPPGVQAVPARGLRPPGVMCPP